MKKISIILSITMLLFGCSEDNLINLNQNQYLVDKVYDYNNNLLAEYFYNDNNQLVMRKDTDQINNRSSDYEFEYENNRVSKIIYTDYTFPQFSHFIKIYYNDQGQIFKVRTFKNDQLVGGKN